MQVCTLQPCELVIDSKAAAGGVDQARFKLQWTNCALWLGCSSCAVQWQLQAAHLYPFHHTPELDPLGAAVNCKWSQTCVGNGPGELCCSMLTCNLHKKHGMCMHCRHAYTRNG